MSCLRVLIADDAGFLRAILRDILSKSGRYVVVGEATTGREVVHAYGELRPDLVTMDIMMPDMDGLEATREILRQDPDAAIVMCSALGQEELVIESIALGARDFIVKPFTQEGVLRVLDSVLQAV